jgi:hypothetical protein
MIVFDWKSPGTRSGHHHVTFKRLAIVPEEVCMMSMEPLGNGYVKHGYGTTSTFSNDHVTGATLPGLHIQFRFMFTQIHDGFITPPCKTHQKSKSIYPEVVMIANGADQLKPDSSDGASTPHGRTTNLQCNY